MTTLYRPVLIETAAQAEAMPIGTIARHPEFGTACVKTDVMDDGETLWYDTDDDSQSATSLVGWEALVPVEAEEEGQAIAECEIGVPGSERITHQRRLVTRWEDA